MGKWMPIVLGLALMACSGGDSPASLDASAQGEAAVLAPDAAGDASDGPAAEVECVEGQRLTCSCPDGSFGLQYCTAGTLGDCECDSGSGSGNGSVGTLEPLDLCEPGGYVGTFTCTYSGDDVLAPIEVSGPVAFDLEANERASDPDCREFCTDLVISEGSGNLFGVAQLFVAFEAQLEGGLDCATGQFRAAAVDGVFGLPSANLDGSFSVLPTGNFEGSLSGTHSGEAPQVVSGDWQLGIPMSNGLCEGPFEVTLEQP